MIQSGKTALTIRAMTNKLPSTTRSLPIALIRARESIMPPIREMLAETGITEQQWRVLRVLAEYGPQSSTDLANRSCLLFPSLTRITRTMSAKGLITMLRDDSDRRRQTISITPKGRKIIDGKADQAAEIVKAIKKKLGAKKYNDLLDTLELLDQDTG